MRKYCMGVTKSRGLGRGVTRPFFRELRGNDLMWLLGYSSLFSNPLRRFRFVTNRLCISLGL